jgi:hypothetical protein
MIHRAAALADLFQPLCGQPGLLIWLVDPVAGDGFLDGFLGVGHQHFRDIDCRGFVVAAVDETRAPACDNNRAGSGGKYGRHSKQGKSQNRDQCGAGVHSRHSSCMDRDGVDRHGWTGFFVVLIGLQCVYLILWIKVFAWSWLIFWISGRRKMSAHMESFLMENRFPRPPKYVDGIQDYLSRVANDKTEVGPTRVAAAVEVGTFNGVKLAGKYSLALQLQLAFEDALEKYAKQFPPPQEPDEDD